MNKLTLKDISAKMRKLDICMMTSQSSNGNLASRPMSNNGEVEYDGNSYFYTYQDSGIVKEIKENKNINLSFQGKDMLFISVIGKGRLVKNKEVIKEHWNKSLERWFKDGPETEGIILIHVAAKKIKYWHKEEQGEVKL